MNFHIEANVAKINKSWFEEILKYCDEAGCEPSDLIIAHKYAVKKIKNDLIKKRIKRNKINVGV